MASLKKLIADVQDPNDYDGVLFTCIKDGQIANIGFTGSMPSGIDQRAFTYRLLMESGFAIAFPPTASDSAPDQSDTLKH